MVGRIISLFPFEPRDVQWDILRHINPSCVMSDRKVKLAMNGRFGLGVAIVLCVLFLGEGKLGICGSDLCLI